MKQKKNTWELPLPGAKSNAEADAVLNYYQDIANDS